MRAKETIKHHLAKNISLKEMINMSQIIIHKKMSLDEAINTRMTKEQEKAYLELMNIWVNQRD